MESPFISGITEDGRVLFQARFWWRTFCHAAIRKARFPVRRGGFGHTLATDSVVGALDLTFALSPVDFCPCSPPPPPTPPTLSPPPAPLRVDNCFGAPFVEPRDATLSWAPPRGEWKIFRHSLHRKGCMRRRLGF